MNPIKKIFLIFATIFCSTIFGQTNIKIDTSQVPIIYKQKDTSYWVENFRQFRDAIYQRNKIKAKIFCDFPILNENNELWKLVYLGKNNINIPNNVKPFTEIDFDSFFDKIFTKRFINCILKIKTDELYKNGKFTTIYFNDSLTSTTYYIDAVYDKSENKIELNLLSNTDYKDENGEKLDGGEFSIVYFLSIEKNGHIKFKKVRLAG